MIQLYILTIKTDHGDTTVVLSNCNGDIQEEVTKMEAHVQSIYGKDIKFTLEPDINNEITRTKYPDHYRQIIANAMKANAQFN